MASTLFQFYVDDDSPEIAYFPFVNLEPSPNITDGWQLLYTGSGAATGPGQVGVGASYHYTSLNGASFLITWNGTGIDLMGNVSNALYNVTLDGIPNTSYSSDPANTVLASFNDLDNTNHSLLLTTIITNTSSPNAFLTFDEARITYTPPADFTNTTSTTQAISDSSIAFMGLWNYVADSTGNSMHVSNTAGDRAQTMFLGSAITVYGLTSSYSGKFTVTLDNVTTSLSAQSSYNNSDALLFYATELPQDMPHQLTVTNLEDRTLALRAGGMNITFFGNGTILTSSSESSSTPAGTIAAIVLAIVLFLVLCGIIYFACYRRRKARVTQRRDPAQTREWDNNEKADLDVDRVIDISPTPGEELETASLSTSKGYGFGLGLRRGFPFAYRKGKLGSSSSGRSRNGSGPRTESHPMTPRHDRDEKRLSVNTLTEDLPVFYHALESEKLAPGWSNPVARMSPPFKHSDFYKEQHGISLPGLHREPMKSIDDNCDDDTDGKTLTSRQNEALAAALSLSPRTSEAPTGVDVMDQNPETHNDSGVTRSDTQFLQVRDTSPFRVDVSAILGSPKDSRDSKRNSGSGSSTWSRVRARLYRKAHRDDGRQIDGHETSSSSGPESVPVVMLESGSAQPPSETAPASGTYSFLDFASSRASLQQHSKTTVSSTDAETGHGTRETRAWSENTSIKMVRIERSRDDMAALKPDAPSTASAGSNMGTPSDNSGGHTHPDAPTTHINGSSPFPFPITITPSTHLPHPYNYVLERHTTPSPPPSANAQQHLLQVPPTWPRPISEANSTTESVPISVSEIHFRHSFSDYGGLDSRRASAASALPPHPPLPHRDSSQGSTPTYSPPPPYIVQRVLGLPMTPLGPVSPPAAPDSPTGTVTASPSGRPGTAPSRIGSLLGPRPKPRPSTAGSVRGTTAPQLPIGRNIRSPR